MTEQTPERESSGPTPGELAAKLDLMIWESK